MARGIDFRKPRLGEYTGPSSLCVCQYQPKVSQCSRNRISVSSEKGLNFITNDVFLFLKYDENYAQLIGFSYDKKSANIGMWKDKEYEYISSA